MNNPSIAILDTGVAPVRDLSHPQNRIIAHTDFINQKNHPYDEEAVIIGLSK